MSARDIHLKTFNEPALNVFINIFINKLSESYMNKNVVYTRYFIMEHYTFMQMYVRPLYKYSGTLYIVENFILRNWFIRSLIYTIRSTEIIHEAWIYEAGVYIYGLDLKLSFEYVSLACNNIVVAIFSLPRVQRAFIWKPTARHMALRWFSTFNQSLIHIYK